MKLLLLFLAAATSFAGDWEAIGRLPNDQRIQVTTQHGARVQGAFISVSGEGLVIRDRSGERLYPRAEVGQVRVFDQARRVRMGLLWTAVGAGIGLGAGFAVCPYCPNEGHEYKFTGPGLAVGAGVGALGFLSSPYRAIYKRR